MKILTYCLFGSLLFLFCECEFLEEEDCTTLPSSIDINIYVTLDIGATKNEKCDSDIEYAVDFYKDHCGGGLSQTMSYLFNGCYEEDGHWYLQKKGIGTWSITIKNNEDAIYFNLVEYTGKVLASGSVTGKRIYEVTNQGGKGLHVLWGMGSVHYVFAVN
ncbi:MAG: hypothetical protein KAQ62_02120 [Cyclobacteriaceae bacterium]|nr:hypothetical protein [Cyclobacteriaceae bacterium]